jgi:hypothetical protein
MKQKMHALISIGVATMLPLVVQAQVVRTEVVDYNNGCKAVQIFNNQNKTVAVTIDYEYKGRDGSFFRDTNRDIIVYGASSKEHFLWNGGVDCKKGYTVKVTNVLWRF